MNVSTILLIDDDIDLCQSIKNLLMQHGFNVILAHNSNSIETILKNNNINLVLLDILLPGSQDGIAICRLIRQLTTIPVIMLTGVNEDIEKIVSLEIGADNYLIKPFNSRVLLAHINACLRRSNNIEKISHPTFAPDQAFVDVEYQIYEFQNCKLNITSHILLSPLNELIKLTPTEFILLQAFLERPQCVLSRNQLLDLINNNSESFDRSIDILISRLRSKLEPNLKSPKIINTVRNSGYLLNCSVSKSTINSQHWQTLILSTKSKKREPELP